MSAKRTSRGFRIYAEFKDTHGNKVRVQQSSADPCNRVYLFVENDAGSEVVYFPADNTGWHNVPRMTDGHPGYAAVSPHLSPAQCRRLIRALEQHLKEVGTT